MFEKIYFTIIKLLTNTKSKKNMDDVAFRAILFIFPFQINYTGILFGIVKKMDVIPVGDLYLIALFSNIIILVLNHKYLYKNHETIIKKYDILDLKSKDRIYLASSLFFIIAIVLLFVFDKFIWEPTK